jgi:hypothetical protein
MAHFAHLDKNNIVTQVVVVSNEQMIDENGFENKQLGIDICNAVCGKGIWVQTSYNGNFRGRYAGIGFTYDKEKDAFIPPKPYDSWLLDEDTCLWNAPVAMPTDGKIYTWNEDTTSWVEIKE